MAGPPRGRSTSVPPGARTRRFQRAANDSVREYFCKRGFHYGANRVTCVLGPPRRIGYNTSIAGIRAFSYSSAPAESNVLGLFFTLVVLTAGLIVALWVGAYLFQNY